MEILQRAVQQRLRPEELFLQVICLEWYDGPLSGMLAFRDEPSEYRFDLVDDARIMEHRVFKIAPLPEGTIERFTNMLSVHGHAGERRWPIWCPVWDFPTDAARSAASAAADEMLRAASSPVAAFCWSLADDRITACRPLGGSDTMPEDWFSWLGLERPGGRTDIRDMDDC